MRINHTKRKLQSGEVALGIWLGLGSPRACRALAANAGYDWLTIDTEHSPIDRAVMSDCVAAIVDGAGGKVAPLARVPDLSPGHIKQVLDAGAFGILAPMVMGAADARLFVENCLYPPKGMRGVFGGAQAVQLFDTTAPEYFQKANAEILVMVQIETRAALDEVDAIAAVEGLDVLFVGPNDLHAALGLQPSYESSEPAFVAALKAVVDACRRHGKAAGILCANAAQAKRRIAEGFRLVGIASDVGHLLNGAKAALAEVAA